MTEANVSFSLEARVRFNLLPDGPPLKVVSQPAAGLVGCVWQVTNAGQRTEYYDQLPVDELEADPRQ